MKKVKFVALVLSAAVMIMGAGYAAWNETVTINNTVETGELSVALGNGSVNVFKNISDGAEPAGMPARIAEATLDAAAADKNVENVKVTNLYPGAHVHISIPLTNDGSIPVKVNGVNLIETNVPAWVTVTQTNLPDALDTGATENITYTLDVADNAPESQTNVTFSLAAQYGQFNQ